MHRRISIILLALAQATHAQASYAQEAGQAAISWNLGAVSDYRYRGISQTRLHPALQGGADYAGQDGYYAGTWLSTVSWAKDAGGGGRVEWDLYAGRKGMLAGGVSYDLGLLGYVYPGNGLARVAGYVDGNTGEVYGQLGYGPCYLKYSTALTNLFGVPDSRYSSYLDLGASLEAGRGFTLNLHAGRQHVQHSAGAGYTDWKAGVGHAWGAATVTLSAIGTNAGAAAYTSAANGRYLGRTALLLELKRSF